MELIQRTPRGKRNNGVTTIPRGNDHVDWNKNIGDCVGLGIGLYAIDIGTVEDQAPEQNKLDRKADWGSRGLAHAFLHT